MSPSPSGALATPERNVRALLHDRNYLCIWGVGGLTGIVRWLQLLVMGVYTFETTGSPLLVSLIPILWMAPLALCGPLVGVYADRVNRRTFLLVGLALIFGLSVTMATIAFSGALTFLHVAVAAALSGLFWATDMPVRRRFMGDLAGDSLSTAMSLDSATGNATRMAGPFLGGIMLQLFNMTGVFILSSVLFAACFLLVLTIRSPGRRETGTRAPAFLSDLLAGIRFVSSDANLRRIFAVTIIFNLFGFPFTSMVPVLGRAQLDLSAVLVGLLSSMEGLGAFLGATMVAIFARPAYFQLIYVGGTTAYLCMLGYLSVLTFVAGGPLHSFLATSATLVVIGTCSACFAAMQSTLTYLGAPPALRSRVLGVLTLCIGTGPLGFFNIGIMAEAFGVPTALGVSALEGLLVLGVLWAFGGRRESGSKTETVAQFPGQTSVSAR